MSPSFALAALLVFQADAQSPSSPPPSFHFMALSKKDKDETFVSTARLWNQALGAPKEDRVWVLPCASEAFDSLQIEALPKNRRFVNCVTATEKFDAAINQAAPFPGISSYLNGVAKRLLKHRGQSPHRLVIVYQKERTYLEEHRPQLLNQFATPLNPRSLIKVEVSELANFRPLKSDWVLFWTSTTTFKAINDNRELWTLPFKIWIYPLGISQSTETLNSAQILFWHPNVYYEDSKANCHFTKDFKKFTGRPPDFHAAYFWAGLQLYFGMKSTILGKIDLNEKGRPQNYIPLLRLTEEGGSSIIDFGSQSRGEC